MTSAADQEDISVISNPVAPPLADSNRPFCPKHQNYSNLANMCMSQTARPRDYPWPFSQNCLHGTFLLFFIFFLIVGVALTCLGFMNYGHGMAITRTFKILGILALLLCIGFLIAACVIVSDCLTSVIAHTGNEEYSYNMLFPSYSESLASARLTLSESDYSWHSSRAAGMTPSYNSNPVLAAAGPRLHMCPSCSCHTLRVTSPNDGVLRQMTSDNDRAARVPEEVSMDDWPGQQATYSADPETDEHLQQLAQDEQRRQWV